MNDTHRHLVIGADILHAPQRAALLEDYRRAVQIAAAGLLDFVLLRDARALLSNAPAGRLDALSVAARLAPEVAHIGLVVGKQTTSSEPFTVSRELATLDLVSGGRAGWFVQTLQSTAEAQNYGTQELSSLEARSAQSDEYVAVSRKLWDSWEDDAVVVDRARGWYLNPHKLHHIDHRGQHFQIRGPSITYRPPQGHVVVMQSDEDSADIVAAAANADVIIQHNRGLVAAQQAYAAQQTIAAAHGRTVRILQRVVIVCADTTADAYARSAQVDAAVGKRAQVMSGTAEQVADQLGLWFNANACDGYVLENAGPSDDYAHVIDAVIPVLQRRGLFHQAYHGTTLREHLGLKRPANPYTGSASEAHIAYEGAR